MKLDPRTQARAVVRYDDSTNGTPGPTAYGPPDLDASFEREDLVLSATLRRDHGRFSQQASVGYSRTDQLSLNPADSGCYVPEWEGQQGAFPMCDFPNPSGFQNLTDRLAAGYQADVAARVAPPADRRSGARARDGRARQPLGGPAAAGAHQLRRLPAGPRCCSGSART